MDYRKAMKALALVAVLSAMTAAAWAGVESYRVIGIRPALDVTTGNGDESADLATALTDRVQSTIGNPAIAVTCDMSAASATCVITVALLDNAGDVLGLQQATATATRFRTAAAGNYVAQTLYFDCSSATKYEVRHDDPSTGTVNVRAWVYGLKPQ